MSSVVNAPAVFSPQRTTTRRSSSSASSSFSSKAGGMKKVGGGARAPSSLPHNDTRRRSSRLVAGAGTSSPGGSGSVPPNPAAAFAQLESLLTAAAQAGGSSGDRGWREVEGAWVLAPPNGVPPRAVVHFIGGAFVGASPQLTYRLFLEALCARGSLLIIATPFGIGFDHLRIADEAQFRFDRCVRTLSDEVQGLQVFGVGHSMGALMHMIIGSRYALPDREANVMISFNNKPATDAVPLFAPIVAPGLQGLSPIISGLAGSPLRAPLRSAEAQLRYLSPPVLKELLPVLDQIEPVLLEVANGAAEFIPAPEDTKRLMRQYYAVKRNLLVRFRDDTIDETPQLAATLTESSAISVTLDLAVRSLAGDHVRPLGQELPEVPPEFAAPIVETGDALSGFADMLGIRAGDASPLGQLRAGFEAVKEGAASAVLSGGSGAVSGGVSSRAEMEALADEIIDWMLPGTAPPLEAAAAAAGADAAATGVADAVVTPQVVPPPRAAA